MSSLAPQIDLRTQTELAEQIRKLLLRYCPEVWDEINRVRSDKWADSLIQIYARMMEVIIQHINRVPDKNFLNFLDTMGIGPLPPRPAQTALVFSLAKGAPSYAKVPAGTQVAAAESPDGKPVVFETNKDLVAIKPKVIRAWSISPEDDKYTNHSNAFFDLKSEEYESQQILLTGDKLLPHRLYIGGGDSFAFEEPTDIELKITLLEDLSEEIPWEVRWFVYIEESGQPVEIIPDEIYSAKETHFKILTVYFSDIPPIIESTLVGFHKKDNKQFHINNRWIYAELKMPFPELNILKLNNSVEQEFKKGELVTQKKSDADPDNIIKYPLAEDVAKGANKIVVSKIETRDILTIDPGGSNEKNIRVLEAYQGYLITEPIITEITFSIGTLVEVKGKSISTYLMEEIENDSSQIRVAFFDANDQISFGENERELVVGVSDVDKLSAINEVNFKILTTENDTSWQPDVAFLNRFPLDTTKDFFPFGERPKLGDTFYIGSLEVFNKVGAQVDIRVVLNDDIGIPDTENISLQWEYWDGKTWALIGETKKTNGPSVTTKDSFSDSTEALTQEGTIQFKCPSIALREINGEENFWVRIRIVGGNYGEDAKNIERTVPGGWLVKWREDDGTGNLEKQKYNPSNNQWVVLDLDNDKTEWVYEPPTYKPPIIHTLALSYEPVFIAPDAIVLHNNFFYEEVEKEKDPESNPFDRFIPFKSIVEEEDALYFAFDSDISTLPVPLFFPLITEVSAVASSDVKSEPPSLKWEYWNGSKWSAIPVEDETKELTRRGMVSLLIPEDCKQIPRFEENKYWIRARLEKGVYDALPRLASVHTNAVWAKSRVTVPEELLGSGNGTPGQQLNFSNAPLLSGQQIFVREVELTAEEKNNIIDLEGDDALQPAEQQTGVTENWVRWHEVNHFWFSDPHSRHYIIDRQNGSITFGDGKRGMIPQAGRNNIKGKPYKYGGGVRGNVKKSQLTKLRKAIPYIDSVFNPVDAEGGTDVENMAQVRDRGPRSIRHRNKAVTLTDYEWIVQEASPKIAKVKGLSVTNPQKQFRPGWVTMMVLPHSDDVKPLPSAELTGEVTTYLSRKAMTCLADEVELQQINIIPPNYLRIDAAAKVVVKNISDAKEAESLVSKKLMQFFHPITGGPANAGWEFGRDVYKSEIYEALEGIEKVDYVHEIALKASEQLYEINVKDSIKPAINFPDHSMVRFDENITLSLAETMQKGAVTQMKVFGFMEGDHIELRHERTENSEVTIRKKIRLFIQNVEDVVRENKCIISCAPVRVEESFPANKNNERTVVETFLKPDGQQITSYLVTNTSDNEISQIEIAVPKAGDAFTVTHRDWRSNILSGTVQDVINTIDNIFLEKDSLVYSGSHTVRAYLEENIWEAEPFGVDEMEPGAGDGGEGNGTASGGNGDQDVQEYLYLLNTKSGEVHDLMNVKFGCSIPSMKAEHKRYFVSLTEIGGLIENGTYDYCAWCFGKELSNR